MKAYTINLGIEDYTYDKELKTFFMNEKDVQFSMTYELYNPDTGNRKSFELSHSTGGEFEPTTRWIYKSDDGLTLEICNDPEISKRRGDAYLKHKVGNIG